MITVIASVGESVEITDIHTGKQIREEKNCPQQAAEQELQERARTSGTDLKNTASVSRCGAQCSQQ